MREHRATPYAKKIAAQYHIDLDAVTPTGRYGEILAADVERAHDGRKSIREVPVTPLAARIAAERGVDLSRIRGTGIGGKISKRDVLKAAGHMPAELLPGELRVSMSMMRRKIAEQMTKAAAVPTSTLVTKVDMTALLAERKRQNESARKAGREIHYTINDLILYAVSRVLSAKKKMLCSYDEDAVIYKSDVNIGIATAVDEGLLVPVLREADRLTLGEISAQVKILTEKARSRTLTAADCCGNTFTVSNLGMYEVEEFFPLLNLPDAAILGIASVLPEEGGAVQAMRLCLTYDHRLLDGRDAAEFNQALKHALEDADRFADWFSAED